MFYILYSIFRVISCYPQVFHNAQRGSVEHLSSDFVVWSAISPLLILVHIALLRWDPIAREQYSLRYPLEPTPSTQFVSSKGFAPDHPPGASLIEFFIYLHATVIWGWIVLRSQMNRKYAHTINIDHQGFSMLSQFFLGVILFLTSTLFVLASIHLFHGNQVGFWGIKWLDVVYILYAFGELISWFRYVPQIPINFLARSTLGLAPKLVYTEAVGLLFLWISQLSKVHQNGGRWKQLTLPNSVFLLLLFRSLTILKLLHQMFAYRANNLKKLALLPQPATSTPSSPESTHLSPTLFDSSMTIVANLIRNIGGFANRVKTKLRNPRFKGESAERLLNSNEMTVITRDTSKDS